MNMRNPKNANKSAGNDQRGNGKDRTDKNASGNSNKNEPGSDKDDHKPTRRQSDDDRNDEDEEPVTEADLDPGKQIQIDDDPEQTRRKIPNMEKSPEKGKRG